MPMRLCVLHVCGTSLPAAAGTEARKMRERGWSTRALIHRQTRSSCLSNSLARMAESHPVLSTFPRSLPR